MKINEIIFESPADIKLLLASMGFNIYSLRNNSAKIKKQFLTHNKPIHVDGMKHYLSRINFELIRISQLSQWKIWSNTADGKAVQRELDNIFAKNTEFMKKYG